MGAGGVEGYNLLFPADQDEFTAVDGDCRHLAGGQGYGREGGVVAVCVGQRFCFVGHGGIIAGYGRLGE